MLQSILNDNNFYTAVSNQGVNAGELQLIGHKQAADRALGLVNAGKEELWVNLTSESEFSPCRTPTHAESRAIA